MKKTKVSPFLTLRDAAPNTEMNSPSVEEINEMRRAEKMKTFCKLYGLYQVGATDDSIPITFATSVSIKTAGQQTGMDLKPYPEDGFLVVYDYKDGATYRVNRFNAPRTESRYMGNAGKNDIYFCKGADSVDEKKIAIAMSRVGGKMELVKTLESQTCVILGGHRDAVSFAKMTGMNTCCFSSETMIPDDATMLALKEKYPVLLCMYDIDKVGYEWSSKLYEQHGICNVTFEFQEMENNLGDIREEILLQSRLFCDRNSGFENAWESSIKDFSGYVFALKTGTEFTNNPLFDSVKELVQKIQKKAILHYEL